MVDYVELKHKVNVFVNGEFVGIADCIVDGCFAHSLANGGYIKVLKYNNSLIFVSDDLVRTEKVSASHYA